jgi:Fe-S oxidoreductase
MRAIAEEASALVRKYKGAYSGEHGDGLCRGEWIQWQFGPALNEAFRAIKTHLDPAGLLNPGKIIDPPKMDDARLFRFAPGYKTIPLQPVFDWSAWNVQNNPVTEETSAPGSGGDNTGGLAKAVEMCNNNGHCRKFDAGTMCPSYRVTRDEQHLTRGRANTLRLALSGQIPGGIASDAVHQALDLCVGCKGCKRDCPTGVDMARMKLEATAQRAAVRGLSLKDRLFARLPDIAPRASRLPALFNLRNRLPWARALGERWLGLSARRSLPRFRRDTFVATAPALGLATAAQVLERARQGGLAVVLFVDTFNGHFETENARDAVQVLQAAGYAVHVATQDDGRAPCCGRTLLAAGLADQAKTRAAALLQAFLPFVDAGLAVVGLEPSCLLTLRDEFLVMGLGLGDEAQRLAAQALLFEEFLAREQKAGRLKLTLREATRPLLVHGHCHQKAFGALSPVLDVLRLIPGADVAVIESSCCGMAGAFGYEAAHHEVSLQMAELSLLPAVRARPDALIVADGTSCRHQIADGAQRQALHVARVLAAHLTPRPPA